MNKRSLAAAAGVVLLTACGSSKPDAPSGADSGGSSSSAKASAPAVVTVKGFAFHPGNLTVQKGTKLTWKFEDTTKHTVTADDKKFHSNPKGIQKGTYSYTFNTPGKYSYYCSIHQYMQGRITVKR